METLSERALCSLDDVKQYINLETDVDQDELLIRLINAASEAIYSITNREFVGPDSLTSRSFDVQDVWVNGRLYLGDFQDIEAVTIYSAADELVAEVDIADITYYPRVIKSPGEAQTAISIRNQSYNRSDWLLVSGMWGFYGIPEEIRQACIVTVAIWHARDIADFSGTFSIAQDRVELPRAIPPHVADTISRYQTAGAFLG